VTAHGPPAARLRVRQPLPPDIGLTLPPGEGKTLPPGVGKTLPDAGGERIDGELVARRRGRHTLPAIVVRQTGPLGLMRRDHRSAGQSELLVYPDLPAARRLAHSVRTGAFRDDGKVRGELGLGTDFEHIGEYGPDDDIRHVNWPATNRVGRPMSNRYREDRDREVMCVVDAGRLMASPVGDGTRLDTVLDAVAAVAAVADVMGDRIGVIAYDREVRTELRPRRDGGRATVRALFDLEPSPVESDHERAFHRVAGGKRRLVIVFTDMLDEQAASFLIDSVPVLTRRHAVLIAGVADDDISALLTAEPDGPIAVYRASVAAEMTDGRDRVAARLRRTGTSVVDAPADQLSSRTVGAYLRLKSRARL